MPLPSLPAPAPRKGEPSWEAQVAEDPSLALSGVSEKAILKNLEVEIGRGNLLSTLEIEHDDPETPLGQLTAFLGDPSYARSSLTTLCNRAGVSVKKLLEAYRSSLVTKAQVSAMQQSAEKVPAIMADVVERALPREESCLICSGIGKVPVEKGEGVEDCRACKGTGRYMAEPDFDRQKFVLETFEIGPKRGGGTQVNLSVSQTNQTALLAGGLGRTFHALQAATDRILYHQPSPTPVRGGAGRTLDVAQSPTQLSPRPPRTASLRSDDRDAPGEGGGARGEAGQPGAATRHLDGSDRPSQGGAPLGQLDDGDVGSGLPDGNLLGGGQHHRSTTQDAGAVSTSARGIQPPPGTRPIGVPRLRLSHLAADGDGPHHVEDCAPKDGRGAEAQICKIELVEGELIEGKVEEV